MAKVPRLWGDESMKSRSKTLIRAAKASGRRETAEAVAQSEGMIADFARIVGRPSRARSITSRERAWPPRSDAFAYPTLRPRANTRRDNLKRSADELKVRLEGRRRGAAEPSRSCKRVRALDELDNCANALAKARASRQSRPQGAMRAATGVSV